MDLPSNQTPTSGIPGPVEFIVAFGHRVKRINSKDKLNNGTPNTTPIGI